MKAMNHRERTLAVLRYQPYDRLPVVHFGYWRETLEKWAAEGRITREEAEGHGDGNEIDQAIAARLGFDFQLADHVLQPKRHDARVRKQGCQRIPRWQQACAQPGGVVTVQRADATGIPAEIDHLLKDRASWEEHYKWRYVWSENRVIATGWSN